MCPSVPSSSPLQIHLVSLFLPGSIPSSSVLLDFKPTVPLVSCSRHPPENLRCDLTSCSIPVTDPIHPYNCAHRPHSLQATPRLSSANCIQLTLVPERLAFPPCWSLACLLLAPALRLGHFEFIPTLPDRLDSPPVPHQHRRPFFSRRSATLKDSDPASVRNHPL